MRRRRSKWTARHKNFLIDSEHQLELSVSGSVESGFSDFTCLVHGPGGNNYTAHEGQLEFQDSEAVSDRSQFVFPRDFRPGTPHVLPSGRYRIEWTALVHIDDDPLQGHRVVVAKDRFYVGLSGTFSDSVRVFARAWLSGKIVWIVGLFVAALITALGTQFGVGIFDFLTPDRRGAPSNAPRDLPIVPTVLPSATLSPSPESSSAKVKETEFVLYRPVSEEGRIDRSFRINHHDRGFGACTLGSLGNPGNPDTWRCFGTTPDNRGNPRSWILDPCWYVFVSPGKVVCPESPWSRQAIVLSLREPLPLDEINELAREEPWAVELSNGEKCVHRIGGTASPVAGEAPTYFCRKGEVVGLPDRSRRVWRVFYSKVRETEVRQVEIITAWF